MAALLSKRREMLEATGHKFMTSRFWRENEHGNANETGNRNGNEIGNGNGTGKGKGNGKSGLWLLTTEIYDRRI